MLTTKLTTVRLAVIGFVQGSATCSIKKAIQLHLPADMTGEESQNVDSGLFFTQIHGGIG